jgi:general secretion pathway protein K
MPDGTLTMWRRSLTQRQSRPTYASQQGAAIVTALLVVTLAVVLVSGLLWRQQVQIRSIENQRLRAQADWIFNAALDYARLVLRDDLRRTPVDHLGEVWAVPIAETRLSEFLGASLRTDSAGETSFIAGRIVDAEARFNLTNLVNLITVNGVSRSAGPNGDAIAAYRRLLDLLNINPALAEATARHLEATLGLSASTNNLAARPADQAATESSTPRVRPLMALDDLLAIPGYDEATIARLAAYVIVLPQRTTHNANTAPAEVLSALLEGLPLPAARALVTQRSRAHFISLADLQNQLRAVAPERPLTNLATLDVRSGHFLVYGQVRHERAERMQVALVQRHAMNSPEITRVIWVRPTSALPAAP